MPEISEIENGLIRRGEARRLLGGVGVETLEEHERSGRLRKIKFKSSQQGHAYYLRSDVLALIAELVPPRPLSEVERMAKPKIERAVLTVPRTVVTAD